jgi:hypothetical protein
LTKISIKLIESLNNKFTERSDQLKIMMIEMRTDANNEMKRQQDSHSKLTAVIDDIEMKLNTVVS